MSADDVRSTDARRLLVFLPGFLVSPGSYRRLLDEVAQCGIEVIARRLYRPGPNVLAGRFTTEDEAAAAERVLADAVALHAPEEVWLAGHSRGGQAAWLLADRVDAAGLIVLDPVDGTGRRPTTLHAAARPATFGARTLVIGAGLAGRCAPAAVNHEHFARAAPPGSAHIVVPTMGHGDLLDDRPARVSQSLCGGSDRPADERSTVAQLMSAFIADELDTVTETPTPFVVS